MPFIQASGTVDAHGRLKALVNYGKPKGMLAQPAKKGERGAGSRAPPDCVRGRHVLHVAEEVVNWVVFPVDRSGGRPMA
jgi:hypothetical protein